MANGNRDQIILFIQSKFIFENSIHFQILSIYWYATASTESAAYIIGGRNNGKSISTIAQFKDNKWLKIGDLSEKKHYLSAIFYDGEYLIVGGSSSGR